MTFQTDMQVNIKMLDNKSHIKKNKRQELKEFQLKNVKAPKEKQAHKKEYRY